MNQLLCIPEFVNLMSSHMDLATLAACVRVCKAWHEICIPHLWHTFGAFSQQPVRIGSPHPPKIVLPRDTTFPLYVSKDDRSDGPSKTKIPVFSMARPEIYPGSIQWVGRYHEPKTTWDRLFSGALPNEGDEEIVALIVAKHVKHIRCLVLRSYWAFDACEFVCRQLVSLCIETTGAQANLLGKQHRICHFVKQQKHLRSIALPRDAFECASLARLDRDWLYFGVMLDVQDLGDLHSLLPHTRTVSLNLMKEGDEAKPIRLSCPHMHLKELDLLTKHFDHRMLRDILDSFPNLQRLTVGDNGARHRKSWRQLDLILDNGYTMLAAQGYPTWDICELLPLLPNLLVFMATDISIPLFDKLAQHCPCLVYCHVRKNLNIHVPHVPILHPRHGDDIWVTRTTPDKSISRLPSSCRDLVGVYCDQWSMGIEDIVSGPGVCHKLKNLDCVFVDVPLLSDAEQAIYRSLLQRRQDRVTADQQDSQSDSEWMSEDERAVDRKAKSLKTYINAIEEQLQRLPEVDLKPRRVRFLPIGKESFLDQMEGAKTSISV